MTRLHLQHPTTLTIYLSVAASLLLVSIPASAQLAPNQTNGFGNNQLVTFTYLQNFDCVDQPLLDLDFNGIAAQSDPNEMQTPICQVVTEPTEDPTGGSIKHTAHLYVFVPMFSVDNDQKSERRDAMPEWWTTDRALRPRSGLGFDFIVRICSGGVEDSSAGSDSVP